MMLDVYVTDALKLIAENTARISKGSALKSRYFDLLERIEKTQKEETRTSKEVINGIKGKLAKMGGDKR